MRKAFRAGALSVFFFTRCAALGANYYVSVNGSDSNPGTLELPFRNIQKAAFVMAPGDTAFIRAGTYRETVRPSQSGTQSAPITFEPYQGETVTVSGADPVAGSWTPYSGNIFSTPLATDLGDANQIFADGQMMMEARWPNTTLDIAHPVWARASAGSLQGSAAGGLTNGQITDPQLAGRPAGYWNGAKLHIRLGSGWGWQTGTVLNSTSTGVLSFTYARASPPSLDPRAQNPYFLTGKLEELDTAGEWFRDGDGNLYLWAPDGDDPTQHAVEVKSRTYAFDLTKRSFITIAGLNFFAASINSDAQSQSLILEGLYVKYVSQFSQTSSPYATNNSGLILNGANHILRNSEIAFSAGDGVALHGSGHLVHGLEIYGADYAGTYGAAIALYGGGSTVAYNSLHDLGRYGVMHSGVAAVRILHNEVFNYGVQTNDVGCVYSYNTDGKQTEIAYNLCHDTGASLGVGVYLDNGDSNMVVHHNVVWNVSDSMIVNPVASNDKIYNNTFLGQDWGLNIGPKSAPQLPGTEFKNNIFDPRISVVTDAVMQANLTGANPRFVDPAAGNFQLQAGSPAINAGVVIPPFTDGYTGTRPDLGAYDHGLPGWAAGSGQNAAELSSLASFTRPLAPGAIGFASGAFADIGVPGDLSIQLRDAAGALWTTPVLQASSSGIVFVIPRGVAAGPMLVTVKRTDGKVFVCSAGIFAVAPGLFTANHTGSGLAAGYAIRVKPNGTQIYENITTLDSSGNAQPLAIDLGAASDQVFLIFGATGIEGASSLSNVLFRIGGLAIPASGTSSPADSPGIDYAGLLLPRSLAGKGQVPVTLIVDGQTSNTVNVVVK